MPRLLWLGLHYLMIAALLLACDHQQSVPTGSTDIQSILSGQAHEGFQRADSPRTFHFPADHGPHPQFKLEWWYITGNLTSQQQQHFGFQITFFRFALSPQQTQRDSHWANNQMYMAHFAITDVAQAKFHHFQRMSRAALDLAGAQTTPFKVWVYDWTLQSETQDFFPLSLTAQDNDINIKLNFQSEKPLILQGTHGLSQKSRAPGNASYYYSFTRLLTTGQIHMGNNIYQVTGLSWMDREWSTSTLAKNQIGWDWFALQLSNQQEIMFYQIRQKNGQADPMSRGTHVHPDGQTTPLLPSEVNIKILKYWTSDTGITYPNAWQISIPKYAINLSIIPYIANQEINLSMRYWEGAVKINGSMGQEQVSGHGYVELSGYAKKPTKH